MSDVKTVMCFENSVMSDVKTVMIVKTVMSVMSDVKTVMIVMSDCDE